MENKEYKAYIKGLKRASLAYSVKIDKLLEIQQESDKKSGEVLIGLRKLKHDIEQDIKDYKKKEI